MFKLNYVNVNKKMKDDKNKLFGYKDARESTFNLKALKDQFH